MGMMSFLLPSGLPAPAAQELQRACLAGGYDQTPVPTRVLVRGGQLSAQRDMDESGYLVAPWDVDGAGQLLTTTATLMERDSPYLLAVELTRGKVNQLRNQLADWKMAGLQTTPELEEQIRAAVHSFGLAICALPGPESQALAQAALGKTFAAGEALVGAYTDQVFRVRHQRHPQLDTLLACRLDAVPAEPQATALREAFNAVFVPINWRAIEPTESNYNWDAVDACVEWARAQNLTVVGGPIIDFSSHAMPDWLGLWDRDLPSLASFMCDYVETVVTRYRDRIRRWQLAAACNNGKVFSLGEDDLLRLTARLAEAAWQIDSELELTIGLSQPWGDYLAREEHTYSPFVFADTLLRAGLSVAAFDLEWFLGVLPRGSYCRDLLDASRLLDLFSILGVPLQVTMGYPSSRGIDPLADPHQQIAAGRWHAGFTPDVQADFATNFAGLALCKPMVRQVSWASFSDAVPHQLPHGGVVDAQGRSKPALDRLHALRTAHLQ
jgi:hypothetical protein